MSKAMENALSYTWHIKRWEADKIMIVVKWQKQSNYKRISKKVSSYLTAIMG